MQAAPADPQPPGFRVALLTTAESWRGSGVSFAQIAQGLAGHGHTPHMLTATDPVTAPFAEQGLPVTKLPLLRTGLREAARLRQAVRDLAADVLIVDLPRDLRNAGFALGGMRTRLVNRYNRNSAPPPKDVLTRAAYRWRVTETVFLTEGGLRSVLAEAPFMAQAPARAIFNGVDGAFYAPAPDLGRAYRTAHGVSEYPLIVAVGALAPQKRYDILLEAVARLPKPRPLVHACGEGPLEESLRSRAAELGIEVAFVGQLAPSELRGAYNAATVFVHSCIGETFGRAIAEAMACGCAVVVPDSGSAPEVAGRDGRTGVVVPPLDPAATAAAVAALLADPSRAAQLGVAARTRVLSTFSLEASAAGYDRLVRDVMAR